MPDYNYTPETWTIYVLKDPRTKNVRYVGFTSQLVTKRLKEHICDSIHGRKRVHRRNWIFSLVSIGLAPIIEEVETGFGSGWAEAEKKWIKFYRNSGAKLVNSTDGGEGVVGAGTPESRSEAARKRSEALGAARRSEIAVKRWQNWSNQEREHVKERMKSSTTDELRRIRSANAKSRLNKMTEEEKKAWSRRLNSVERTKPMKPRSEENRKNCSESAKIRSAKKTFAEHSAWAKIASAKRHLKNPSA